MRKTKIVCTLGPATDETGVIKDMILAGMNVARLNFSHGSHEDHLMRINSIKQARCELNIPVAIMLDTKGPEIRLKKFINGSATLNNGNLFTLTTRELLGNETVASITYKNLPSEVTIGTAILLDDGFISLIVEEIKGSDIICRIKNGGIIKDNKGVNLPDVPLSIPYISEQDYDDFLFGIENKVDFIACSFARNASDIFEVRNLLKKYGGEFIRIIAKIENAEGIENISEIIPAADGIMIARGDLGVEIDFAQIPIIQKQLISKCYTSGKPAITATQMLESMIQNSLPTRAEANDVANAVYDGTSAIMLSGETAIGIDPVNAVKTMSIIAERAEESISYTERFHIYKSNSQQLSIADAVSHAACSTSIDIGAKAIITVTKSGQTARFISKWRPPMPIIACVTDEHVLFQLALSWGVTPFLVGEVTSTDELFAQSAKIAQATGIVTQGDQVVTTAGVPVGISGTTNILRADKL